MQERIFLATKNFFLQQSQYTANFFLMYLRKLTDNILCVDKHSSIFAILGASCFNRNTKYFSPVISLILYVQYLWPCPAKYLILETFAFFYLGINNELLLQHPSHLLRPRFPSLVIKGNALQDPISYQHLSLVSFHKCVEVQISKESCFPRLTD